MSEPELPAGAPPPAPPSSAARAAPPSPPRSARHAPPTNNSHQPPKLARSLASLNRLRLRHLEHLQLRTLSPCLPPMSSSPWEHLRWHTDEELPPAPVPVPLVEHLRQAQPPPEDGPYHLPTNHPGPCHPSRLRSVTADLVDLLLRLRRYLRYLALRSILWTTCHVTTTTNQLPVRRILFPV